MDPRKQHAHAGEELVTVTSLEGWPIVVQLLQDTVDSSRDKLLNCKAGGDPDLVTTLHTRYRAQLEMLEGLQWSIKARIDAFNLTN